MAVVSQESEWNPNAVGDNGNSIGLFQLQPGAAKDAGLHPRFRSDPADNIKAGVTYLKQKLAQSGGNVEQALSRYNRGTPDYRGIGDPNYVQNVLKHYPEYQAQTTAQPQKPGMLARMGQALSPASAEAATTQAAAPRTRLEEIEAELARREGQAPPQTPPAAPGGTQTAPPVSQTAPPATTHPEASQAPATPDTSWTPGMRFQALPSIQQLAPAERTQRTREFAALTPALQEEFLRSEEPASDLTVDIEKPSTPQPGAVQAPRTEAERQARVQEELRQWEQQAGRPWREGDPRMPSEKRLGLPDEAPLEEGITAPSTMIPLLMPGAGTAAIGRQMLSRTAGRYLRPLAEGLSQTLGYGTGRTIETGEVPSAGELGTTLGVTAGLGRVLEQAAPIAAKVGNALRGVVKAPYQAIVDLGERYGVRLSYGDVTTGALAPKVEAALESVPLSGAGGMRVGQQADVTRAAETVRTGLQTEMQAIPWRNLPALQRAAGQGNQQAQALLNEIVAAGNDWGRVIQASGKLNLWQDRQRANQLYGRVERLAQPLGNMPVRRTIDAMDNAVDDVTSAVLPSPELQREVETLMSRAKTELTPTQAGVVPDTTYSRMKRLREDLGDMQRTATDPRTARYLGQVKSALQDDMREFAITSKVPALVKAHKQADDFYRTRVVPYREGQLAKAIEKDLPDEIYGKFVRQGADRAQFFYKGLDPRGQAAVRYGMVDEAVKDAASTQHPDLFSPARFVASMRRIQDASGVFFKGAPQWEINGVTKLMQHAQRAGQYAENPSTGVRTGVGALVLGTGAVSIPTALQALLSAQGLRTMLMTQRGRNFLLAASDMQPGSAVFQKRLDTFLRQMPAAAGPIGAAGRSTEETPARAK